MRRTSVYTLSFDGSGLDLDLVAGVAQLCGITLTGSGPDPRPNVMFRASGDADAQATVHQLTHHHTGTRRLKNPVLSTGQGTHTRTIPLKEKNMATKYDVILTDGTGAGQRARKDAAIKLGELQGQPFTVVTTSGETVYDSEATSTTATEAPAPAETLKKEKTVAKSTKAAPAPEPETTQDEAETPVMTVEFEGLGKYYRLAAGLHGAQKVGAAFGVTATITGTTINLFGSEEDAEQVAAHLRALWPAAKLAHRDYRKADATYSAISKDRKDKEANAQRWDLEVKWFQSFMDGAADEIAGSAKKKGGAYKDGVNAVRNPAPEADDADVI